MNLLPALVTCAGLLIGPPSVAGQRHDQEPGQRVLTAARVLHAWDARREAAWATSDPAALRSLYVPGSLAARRDVRLLRAYDERRLVVRRLVTQVFALEVLRFDARHLSLEVVDRVAGGVVEARGSRGSPREREVRSREALGTTRPTARVIELGRAGGTWRVVSVTAKGPR